MKLVNNIGKLIILLLIRSFIYKNKHAENENTMFSLHFIC